MGINPRLGGRGKHTSLVKEIKTLASKYDIELSDDEEKILKGHLSKESGTSESENDEYPEEGVSESESELHPNTETEAEYSSEYTPN